MKKSLKIVATVALVLVIIIVVFSLYQKNKQIDINGTGNNSDIPSKMLETQSPDAAKATTDLINEVAGNVETISLPTDGTSTPVIVKAVTVSQGTSPINIESGKVITKTGEAVVNDTKIGEQTAPQLSFPIDIKTVAIPKSAIKLEVTSSSFTPKEFTVSRGQAVSLFITNVNQTTFSETFFFDDPSLSAVAAGVAKGETKSISFNAPDKAGTYTFYSNMFNHRALGAEGKMIVK